MLRRRMAGYRLRNPIQRYAWGSREALQELLGAPSPGDEPWAELWIGAHARAPSEVEVGGAWRSLRAWIEERPVPVLGARVAARFGAQLPFLLKVLAAEEPLSLQVHPDAERAALGWAEEEAARVPLDAPARRYPDANPKPELVCALAPFEALWGFRPSVEIRARAAALGAERLLAVLARTAADAPPGAILARLLRLPAPERRAIASELAVCAARAPVPEPALAWIGRLHASHPADVACVAPLLMHYVRLERGEALALRPGDLHGYLGGTTLEIMASSDNVLRAGLTPKHVDVPELLRVMQVEASRPARVAAAPGDPGEVAYPARTEWFRLSLLRPRADRPIRLEVCRGAEVLLCLDGRGEVQTADSERPLVLARGEAAFLTGETPRYEVRGDATLARATSGL
jgi:mannose-6-phosphate isomerase